MSGFNYYKGQVHVDVMMFCDYDANGFTIPASPEDPCKLSLPIEVAERFVNNNLAEFCDITEDYGPKGAPGCAGMAGTDGKNGRAGLPGTDGQDGCDGKRGLVGADGDRGRPGINNNTPGGQGKPGCVGFDGIDGQDGGNGADGTPGAKGDMGVRGSKGATGDPGVAGPVGMIGDIGMRGAQGDAGRICAEHGPIECIQIDECTYRIITRDADCNILDDFIWEVPKLRMWCAEEEYTIDFDAEDFKTRDDANGQTFRVPLGNTGKVCVIDMEYGAPSSMPCRHPACGYAGDNPYEQNFPNINAYGHAQAVRECAWVPIKVTFDKPICSDLRINFIDVDKSVAISGVTCEEKVRVTDRGPATLVAGGDLAETPPGSGIFEPPPPASGNSNSDGSITWANLEGGTDTILFDVQLMDGQSMGFGFSGIQTIKTQSTGTYFGDTFYDANGNEINEPEDWFDCTIEG